ncbi:MAG: S9 family peptidase [Bacteroidetes bacterium]|nr:MAG: S9 family peptidase [Bacteroidota bacterium]
MKRALLPVLFILFTLQTVLAQEKKLKEKKIISSKKTEDVSSRSGKQITLEDIYQKNYFGVKRIQGIQSMKNGEHYTTLSTNSTEQFIVKYEYKTGNPVDTLLKNSWLKLKGKETSISFEGYDFNNDETKVLVSSESEQIYRHSTKENYYIYDIKSKTTAFISAAGKQMLAEFSPDGKRIGFVRDNNLFMYDIASGKEIRVTGEGKFNSVINGSTDWVYEEEFSFDKAWFWSPDGSKIAYYRFDESKVKEFSMNKYGTLYPTEYKFKYPKAGEENSKVQIYIYDVKMGTRVMADLGMGTDYEYVPRVKWTMSSNTLSIQRMNRLQNKLELLFADASTGKTRIVLTETSDTYIEISDNLTFLPLDSDPAGFIWTSDRDGYNHLYLHDMNGILTYQITKGSWDVMDFAGYDDKTKTFYYTSTEISPTDKNLYSISLEGTNKKKMSPLAGFDDAVFNSTFTYYIHTQSNANRPPAIALRTSSGAEVRTLEDNTALLKKTNDYNLATKEFFKFTTSDGTELNGWMMKPVTPLPALPKGERAKAAGAQPPSPSGKDGKGWPVLMFVYGGPGSNTVKNSWDRDYFWYQLLCQKGYIIVSVDNRGTGGRGAKFRKCTYKQLGKFETEDQIEAAKYLGTLPYVDKSRIGIWGWSYGGYMSSLCILKGADEFKMAMAVAPVTNWRYYDNVYTERYMGLPKDNASGYDTNSPINHVEKLKGKYLLIHGTADDNVHFQNSVEMADALVKANKQFTFFAYPDKAHGISGGNTTLHLRILLTNFILENL